jgi:succinate dehydrogenase / fumarate reductase cytochrome b subunit
MTNPVATMSEGLRYRGRFGQWAWILHRVGGLGTVLFLFLHVIDTSFVYFWPDHYINWIMFYRTWYFGLGEIALVGCVLYHGLNGLRVALFDLRPELWTPELQQRSVVYVAIAFAVLFVPAAIFMGGNILSHLGG